MAENGQTTSRLALLSFAVVCSFALLWLDSQLPPLGASPAQAGAPAVELRAEQKPILAQEPEATPTPGPCVEVNLEPVTQRLDTIAGRIMPANTLYLEVDGQTYALPINFTERCSAMSNDCHEIFI